MQINPEFQRNLWLEFTRHRLIAAPAILGAIFFLVYLSADEQFWPMAQRISISLIVIATLLWAVRLASEAVATEIKDQTWDSQRMSAITPWNLAWGKLLGSTAFTWYVVSFCFAIYLISGWALAIDDILLRSLLLFLVGLLTQAAALLASLSAIRKDRKLSRSHSAAIFVIVAVGGSFLLSIALKQAWIDWYGATYQALPFMCMALLLWTLWAYAGVYRLMRLELQHRNGPWLWVGFVVFASLFIAGFINLNDAAAEHDTSARLFFVYMIVLLSSYALILSERRDPILIRRTLNYLHTRQFKRFGEDLPVWAITLVMLLLYGMWFILSNYSSSDNHPDTVGIRNLVLATMLFLLRDIGIILFFSFSPTSKRQDGTAMVYLAILYLLLPKLFGLLHLSWLEHLLLPHTTSSIILTLFSGSAQLALIGWLVYRRWQHYFRQAGTIPN